MLIAESSLTKPLLSVTDGGTMLFNSKRLYLNTSLWLLLGYALSFALYYISNYLVITDLTAYIWLFVSRATYLLMPTAAALVIFICSGFDGYQKSILLSIPFALARLVYFIPSYYLDYIVEGFDSLESLGIAAVISLLEAAVSFGVTLLIFIILKLLSEKLGKKPSRELISKKTVFDFYDPTAVAIMAVSAIASIYFIIKEVIDTVVFTIEYGGDFTAPEFIFILISYVFDILIAPIYFFILAYIKNGIMERRSAEPENG